MDEDLVCSLHYALGTKVTCKEILQQSVAGGVLAGGMKRDGTGRAGLESRTVT